MLEISTKFQYFQSMCETSQKKFLSSKDVTPLWAGVLIFSQTCSWQHVCDWLPLQNSNSYIETHFGITSHNYRPGGRKSALVRLSGTDTWVYTLVSMWKVGGSRGMLPRENFLNLMLWDSYVGAQFITTNLCFSYDMVTGFWFTSRLHAWR